MNEVKKNAGKWAPWYWYVVPIAVANMIKQKLVEGMPVAVNAAATLVLIGVFVLVITAVHRSRHANKQRQP
jgi:ABC-type sulfate transport system permease component